MSEPIVVDIGLAMQQLAASPELAQQMNALLQGERYYLTTDNDSHWYVVPVVNKSEWDAWCEIDSDDERAWETPDFARAVGGSPSLVTFSNPEIA
jgi:hypothetical protein